MTMKESGIEWVGLIPDMWSVIPNKYVMHKEKNLCEKWTGEDVMSLTMNGVIVRDLQNPTGKMPATFDGYQYIEDGDLLMCLFDIDVTPRCVGRVTHDGVTSPAYSNFKVHDNASRDYYYYYYLMVDNTKELLHLAKNLRHSFTEEQLGRLKVPMPPLSEQQSIADYLDKTCSKIDEIIVEAKASIDEYKELKQSVIFEVVTKGLDKNVEMKDSKIEQIGKIPQNWSVMRIKNILFERNERTVDGHEEKLSVTQQYGIVKSSEIQIPNPSDSFGGYRVVSVGDIVFNKYKAHSGVFFASPYDGIVTFNYSVYRCYGNQNPIYYEYLFHTQAFIDEFKRRIYGVGESISPLYSKNLLPIPVIVPPLVEQNLIVDYIKKKTQQIDSLIAEKESLINDLETYKKSLIYEVVTGKRRVV